MVVTIVAKGPSAANAQRVIDDGPSTAIATINDAGRLISNQIDFAFFTHATRIGSRDDWGPLLWNRVRCFVAPEFWMGMVASGSPDVLHVTRNELPNTFPQRRLVTYDEWWNDGTLEQMTNRLNQGRIVHHHTTTAAMTWLFRAGCQHLRIVGVDGGKKTVAGTIPSDPTIDLQMYYDVAHRLAVLMRQRGCKVEFIR